MQSKCDCHEEMFGVNRLREILSGLQNAPLEKIKGNVLDAIDDFSRGADQSDAITLAGCPLS